MNHKYVNEYNKIMDIINEVKTKPEKNKKLIGFKQFKSLDFTEDVINTLHNKVKSVKDIFNFNDTPTAHFEADYTLAYYIYRYTQIYGVVPRYICVYDDLLPKSFYKKFIKEVNLPYDSYTFDYRIGSNYNSLGNYILHLKDLFLYFDGSTAYIIFPENFLYEKDNVLQVLMGLMKNYKTPKLQKNKMYVIYRSDEGLKKKSFPINKKRLNIDLNENYNDGFTEVSKEIVDKLNDEKKTGLVILHGSPGTGKTSYIRYLTSKLTRNIIFISPDMVDYITSPEFLPFLMDNSDSVLIIEDAEPALKKRMSDGRTGAVSNILNMTDGLLSDCLNISIVATFNTNVQDIDDALLRKGRLLKSYKFDKLKKDKAKKLLEKNGKDSNINEDMSLAEIYFKEDEVIEDFEFNRRKTGFK